MNSRNRHRSLVRSLFVMLASSLFLIGIAGCGSDPVPLKKQPKAAAPVAVKAKATLPTLPALAGGGQKLSDLTGDEELSFDPKGLRNPFKPFIRMKAPTKKKKTAKGAEKIKIRTPLQRFALEQLSLVGIFWSKETAPKALIQDPAGKGYRVGVGTYVGDRGGMIVKINPKEILVEERTVDILGEPIVKQEKIMLHKFGNEVTQ